MADKELNLSEEEKAFLREIRDERQYLAREIQVCLLPHQLIQTDLSCTTIFLQELRIQIADIDNELSALEEVKNELSCDNTYKVFNGVD